MISRGFAGEGESSSARKAHMRSIRLVEITEVQVVSKIPRLDTSITFSDSDLEGCQHPHDAPLVIRAVVANKTVHRVLVDNGSSADIILASIRWASEGENGTLQHPSVRILRRKGITLGLNTTSTHLGRSPMPSDDDNKIPRCRRPICLEYVVRKTLS